MEKYDRSKWKMISVSTDLKLKLDKEIIKSGIKMSYAQLLEYLIEKNNNKDEYIGESK